MSKEIERKMIADLDTFLSAEKPRALNTPEKELIAGMIWGAINDAMVPDANLSTYRSSKYRVGDKRAAIDWLFDESDEFSVNNWSFRGCCDILEIDTDSFLKAIKEKLKTGMETHSNGRLRVKYIKIGRIRR